jgi:hypothetical protein
MIEPIRKLAEKLRAWQARQSRGTWSLGIIGIVLLGWLVNISPTFKECVREHKNDSAYKALKEDPGIIHGMSLRTELHAVCVENWTEKYEGAIGALATLAIAAFTVMLWRSTDKLWKAGEQQISIVRADFISTHRPRIVVRGLFMYIFKEQCHMQFVIYNNGNSKAEIIKYEFFVLFKEQQSIHMPIIQTNTPRLPVTIESGYDIRWIGWAEHLDVPKLKAAMAGGSFDSFEFRGTIFYEDAARGRRQASFHRTYDFETRNFLRVKDSEFEYD